MVEKMSGALPPRLRLASSGGPPPLLRAGSSGTPMLRLGGLGLALSATGSEPRAGSEELTHRTNVPAGQTVDDVGIAGRTVYLIRDATGTPTGVRKFVSAADERPGAFDAARRELRFYESLRETTADWQEHVLPFRGGVIHPSGVIIDFDWIDGSTVADFAAVASRREIRRVLDIATRQLRWFATAGFIHGDIKADNLYRTVDGRVLLFDFDKARKGLFPAQIMNERRKFLEMIGPYVSSRTRERLEAKGFAGPQDEFYLLASRMIRREGRAQTRRRRSVSRLNSRRTRMVR
jgi:serine/threonine protein kinase